MYWQTRTHCCVHIVAHDVSWAAQTGKHLLRTQNVSEQNQKHFLCPGHKICVRNKCCARWQTGKHLCRQQCVRNNVSSFARVLTPQLPDILAAAKEPRMTRRKIIFLILAANKRLSKSSVSFPSSMKSCSLESKVFSRRRQGTLGVE